MNICVSFNVPQSFGNIRSLIGKMNSFDLSCLRPFISLNLSAASKAARSTNRLRKGMHGSTNVYTYLRNKKTYCVEPSTVLSLQVYSFSIYLLSTPLCVRY